MKLGIANAEARCQGATRLFEAKVLGELNRGRNGYPDAMRDSFDAHQVADWSKGAWAAREAADWKDGFTAENLGFEDAARLAAAIVWYHGAVPVIEGPVAWSRTVTYKVTSPGYAAW